MTQTSTLCNIIHEFDQLNVKLWNQRSMFNYAICGRFAAFGIRRFDTYKNEHKIQSYCYNLADRQADTVRTGKMLPADRQADTVRTGKLLPADRQAGRVRTGKLIGACCATFRYEVAKYDLN